MNIVINGFGRIGRSVYRILTSTTKHKILAINDLSDPQALAYLLKYGTVMGRFNGDVIFEDGFLNTPNQKVAVLSLIGTVWVMSKGTDLLDDKI